MPHYLTSEGYEKLKTELERFKTVARPEVIERIATAKELGDLKENAEYAEAKDDQGIIETKILELEEALKNSVVVDEEKKKGKQYFVMVGSVVCVTCNSQKCEFKIVGPEEADPERTKISYESPIGRALINRKVGDVVLVSVPKGEFRYTIVDIQ